MARLIEKEALTFDDVVLVPQHSNLATRSEASLKTSLGKLGEFELPIISSPMDTITGLVMQAAMQKNGGLGIHHRYNVSLTQVKIAIGRGGIAMTAKMYDEYSDFIDEGSHICVDVAHGDEKKSLDFCEKLAKRGVIVTSGNICTPSAAQRYLNAGANALRVGVGSGSACTTRIVAGSGMPQLQAVMEIRRCFPDAIIISDGGHRSTGDIAKALAFANAVMLGSMLAGVEEAPPELKKVNGEFVKRYRGMASVEALRNAGKEVNPEGVATYVPYQGDLAEVLDHMKKMLRAALAYSGARTLEEFRKVATLQKVSVAGRMENEPHVFRQGGYSGISSSGCVYG